MAAQDLLRNKVDETPTIYAYTLPDVPKYKGLLKVGTTNPSLTRGSFIRMTVMTSSKSLPSIFNSHSIHSKCW